MHQFTHSLSRWPNAISWSSNCFLTHPIRHIYSPQIIFSFQIWRKWLGCKRDANNKEVEFVVNSYFEEFDRFPYIQGIEAIEHRWEKCIELKKATLWMKYIFFLIFFCVFFDRSGISETILVFFIYPRWKIKRNRLGWKNTYNWPIETVVVKNNNHHAVKKI